MAVLGQDYAVDPVWSQDGRILVYSGPDVGTSFALKAMTADGTPYRMDEIAIQTWRDGEIVHERYVYDTGSLAVAA